MTPKRSPRRRFAPEVIQTSAMDCGPAALKCMLEGYGIHVHLGRLRDACQTDVDGTSIDTLETVMGDMGLDASQVMLPVDHLLDPGSDHLPALVVIVQPGGTTHFVVIWRKYGPFLEVMDPGVGRRLVRASTFADSLFIHRMPVPSDGFREWTEGEEFQKTLRAQMSHLGVSASEAERLLRHCFSHPGTRPPATLDAALRMTRALQRAGALRGRVERVRFFVDLLERDLSQGGASAIPARFWTATAIESDPENVLLTGAVAITVQGLRRASEGAAEPRPLNAELRAALTEPEQTSVRALFGWIRQDGIGKALLLVVGTGAVAVTAVIESVLLRSMIDAGRFLGPTEQRLAAVVLLAAFLLFGLGLRIAIAHLSRGMGRRLEARLRVAFLERIPRLRDQYFRSRLTSDLAERAHAIQIVRSFPEILRGALEAAFLAVVTVLGIYFLAPALAPVAGVVAVLSLAVPLAIHPFIREVDLRARVHAGALSRFFLDSLLGQTAVKTHGAEAAMASQHEALLVEWARAQRRLTGAYCAAFAVTGLFAALCTIFLIARTTAGTGVATGLLLLYWTMGLSTYGRTFAAALLQTPSAINTTLRLLEPLASATEIDSGTCGHAGTGPEAAADIVFDKVSVILAGHTVLSEIDLHLHAGEHVAIVGASGAGKSTLAGLLLGWHKPSGGVIRVDGQELTSDVLDRLCRDAAWVDPAVALWNRSMLENLRYGMDGPSAIGEVLRGADLRSNLGRFPDGLQTALGEGGKLVSGGEGQRVRFGRALGRNAPRLVVLDEAFRGLDGGKRAELLAFARSKWSGSTLVCITHDVRSALSFPRVLVVDAGTIVEDADPRVLESNPQSRFFELLSADREAHEGIWNMAGWRRLRMESGTLAEQRMP